MPVDSPPKCNTQVVAKADSGASNNYWHQQDAAFLENITHNSSINTLLPNAQSITSKKQGQLTLHPSLSTQSQQAIVLPQLKSASLISLGQLCDDQCIVLLNKKKILVCKNNKEIINGHRNPNNGLWDIPIRSNYVNHPLIASLYKQNQPKHNSIPEFLQKINTINTCGKSKTRHKKPV